MLIKKSLQPTFRRICRICTAEIKLTHNKLVIISICTHTLQKSEENPNAREDFYEILETLVDNIPKRDIVIIAGDFNAKTGSARDEFKENMSKFGKGLLNSSGRRLLEMCRKQDMVLTNTISQEMPQNYLDSIIQKIYMGWRNGGIQ